MNRREFLLGAGALCATSALATAKPAHSLQAAAFSRGVLFGTEAIRRELEKDPTYAALVRTESGILTPGLEFKWDALRPAPDRFDFTNADWMVNFAQRSGMLVHGHTFCWHEALPSWLPGFATSKNILGLLEKHISTVMRRYRGNIHSWDVVNEIIEPGERRPDSLKNNVFLANIGPDYISRAFHTAREADPTALLVWNENWLESASDYCVAKRAATLKLLRELKRANVPVDCLGLQAHTFADSPLATDLLRFLSEISDLGVKLSITELDVRDRNLRGDIRERDSAVAARYRELLTIFLKQRSFTCAQTWGLSDRYTWINNNASSRRPDGLPSRPLPFDSALIRKRAYEAMAFAFESTGGKANSASA